tara:strand:- start:257 stop:763 length:507 start_codon:yes stop_codon:yes gene_type:complete
MTKSVNLYLASCVSKGKGFWLINFTEEEDIYNSLGCKLLEIYRKELFGLEGAIEVKKAINITLDILAFDSKLDRYKLDNLNTGYSSEIPINLIEDIFDLWAYNYNNETKWKKYIGLLNFKKKIKINNNYINIGLKGDVHEFAVKLDELLSFTPVDLSLRRNKSIDLMW